MLNNYAYFLSEENKDLDKAHKMAKKVFEKFPQMPTYVDTYAWVLFIKKDYKEALSVCFRKFDCRNLRRFDF